MRPNERKAYATMRILRLELKMAANPENKKVKQSCYVAIQRWKKILLALSEEKENNAPVEKENS